MAKTNRKVYSVVGFIPYEAEDNLGIFSSKASAIKAAKTVRLVGSKPKLLADLDRYRWVEVFENPLNALEYRYGKTIWSSRQSKR